MKNNTPTFLEKYSLLKEISSNLKRLEDDIAKGDIKNGTWDEYHSKSLEFETLQRQLVSVE